MRQAVDYFYYFLPSVVLGVASLIVGIYSFRAYSRYHKSAFFLWSCSSIFYVVKALVDLLPGRNDTLEHANLHAWVYLLAILFGVLGTLSFIRDYNRSL